MKILIYDSEITGHHLEYMHHIYSYAVNSANEFIFVVNRAFVQEKDKFDWPEASNVEFVYLTEDEQSATECSNLLKSGFKSSLILRKYVKQLGVDRVWLIMFMKLMPFLPFLLPKGVPVSGILYRIYLYDKIKFSGLRLFLEEIRYKILSKHKNIGKIFVLNDKESAKQLNEMYKTQNFVYLPDPIPYIDCTKLTSVREMLSVDEKKVVYLHFGALDYRKGTIELLQAIDLLDSKIAEEKFFVFAGKINAEMKDEFYKLLEKNRNRHRIRVFDEFCSYEFLNNLCYSCDAILVPYKNAIHSSGVIGYASFFKKPIIGPAAGMLGKIIEQYSMGVLLDEISPESIKNALLQDLPNGSDLYVNEHKIENFCKVVFEGV